MKRSGGVTAAAIVLFLGSALLILFMGLASLSLLLPQPANVNPSARFAGFAFGIALYGLFAVWGIVTAVGILHLRNWARISILIMAGFSAVGIFFAAAMMIFVVPMISQMPGMNDGVGAAILSMFVIMLAIPLGVSMWWLVLFMRKSVRLQFERVALSASSSDLAATGAGMTYPSPMIGAATSSQIQRGVGELATQTAKIPASIIVIAVFLLIGAAFIGLTILIAIQSHIPFMLMGVLISGAEALAVILIMGAIQLILGIALLRRQSWSLNVTVAYAVFGMLNCLLFFVSSSREAYFRIILANYPAPAGAPPDLFPHMMRTILPVSLGFTVVVNLVALYFLWTRREAYRAACAAKR